jgi:prevent-host-death family protein
MQLSMEGSMTVTQISIGQVKRDISELVNRVAYGEERIVLTSRGKPKAAIVSMEDFARLADEQRQRRLQQWRLWRAENQNLNEAILARRQHQPVDVDAIWEASRADLEARHGE